MRRGPTTPYRCALPPRYTAHTRTYYVVSPRLVWASPRKLQPHTHTHEGTEARVAAAAAPAPAPLPLPPPLPPSPLPPPSPQLLPPPPPLLLWLCDCSCGCSLEGTEGEGRCEGGCRHRWPAAAATSVAAVAAAVVAVTTAVDATSAIGYLPSARSNRHIVSI